MDATRRQLLAGAAASLAAPAAVRAATSAPAPARQTSAATAFLADLFQARPAPALSVAVARGSDVLWAQALGHSDLELNVAATPEHSFRLGSVSKVVTTTAAARLVSRGLLDLDAPISDWLSELPLQHRATSLRQLLTHRGGVRHYHPKDLDPGEPGGAIFSRLYPADSDILALFIEDPLVHPPGTAVAYSSFGYTLASMAMQAAYGREFRELIQLEIAGPFGIASLTDDDPWALRPSRASGYMNERDLGLVYASVAATARPKLVDGWANIPSINPAYAWAAGGFLMTPTDAARFGAALPEGPGSRIDTSERRLLFTQQTEGTPQMPALGLGWRVSTDSSERLRWHHEGATPGGRYALTIYPHTGLAIAIAGNVMAMPLDVGDASSKIADIFA